MWIGESASIGSRSHRAVQSDSDSDSILWTVTSDPLSLSKHTLTTIGFRAVRLTVLSDICSSLGGKRGLGSLESDGK
jgi:hypothetical protein